MAVGCLKAIPMTTWYFENLPVERWGVPVGGHCQPVLDRKTSAPITRRVGGLRSSPPKVLRVRILAIDTENGKAQDSRMNTVSGQESGASQKGCTEF